MAIDPKYSDILKEISEEKKQSKVENPNDRILIIDGLNTFIRVFAMYPNTNDNGAHIGGIAGFLKSVGYSIRQINPTRVIIAFDGKGGSKYKRKLYPEYKKKHKPTTRFNRINKTLSYKDEKQSMIAQLGRVVEYLEQLPITVLSVDGVEADEVIAYISQQIYNKDENKIIIMSTDKDFLQLVDDRVSVWNPTKKKLYGRDKIINDYGIPPHNFLMYRILDGDISDNIKGVSGWALKTIQKEMPMLLEDKKVNIEDMIAFSSDKTGKIFENLLGSKDKMVVNYKLMQLDRVEISNAIKLKVMDRVRGKIPKLNKFKFHRIFLRDKLYSAFPDVNTWIVNHFFRINALAEKHNDV